MGKVGIHPSPVLLQTLFLIPYSVLPHQSGRLSLTMILNNKLQKLSNDLKVYHPTLSVLVSLLYIEVRFECLLQILLMN